ncbi:MAG: YndJ family transporter [Planctomycetes bacterium]|nr:YndJ family transporter [Planctomycetota bacterium]MCW8136976.1 YndJ family transporter [Planctomycetota bacterium]
MPPAKPVPAPFSFRALLGGALWVACYAWFRPEWAVAIVWLGALVMTPLALGLVERGRTPFRLIGRAQLPAALLLVAAFVTDHYGFALSLPWIALTAACGATGVWRLAKLGVRRAGAIADVGMFWFAVSGMWAAAYFLGLEVFKLPPLIALLTVVHQTYAGLVLHVVASRIVAWRGNRFAVAAAAGVVAGNPLVATGIAISYGGLGVWFEVAAAVFLSCAAIMLGWVQLFYALWPGSGLPRTSRVLLLLSDLSFGTALTLAIIFAYGTWRGWPTLTIPEMITWHGTLQAFGFSLCALVGWTLAAGKQRSSSVSQWLP